MMQNFINHVEKLGIISSVVDWIEARSLRNYMVHEYMDDMEVITAMHLEKWS